MEVDTVVTELAEDVEEVEDEEILEEEQLLDEQQQLEPPVKEDYLMQDESAASRLSGDSWVTVETHIEEAEEELSVVLSMGDIQSEEPPVPSTRASLALITRQIEEGVGEFKPVDEVREVDSIKVPASQTTWASPRTAKNADQPASSQPASSSARRQFEVNNRSTRSSPRTNFSGRTSISSPASLEGKSALDCMVQALAGVQVWKRKRILGWSVRWIWLGAGLNSIQWTSRRRPDVAEQVLLNDVCRVVCEGQELLLETRNRTRVQFLFPSRSAVRVWASAIMALIPRAASAEVDGHVVERRKFYDLTKDSWRGRAVLGRSRVGQYVLLGSIGKGSTAKVKLAFSTVLWRFYALRMVKLRSRRDVQRDMLLKEECVILKKLRHRNIALHYDVLWDENSNTLIYVVEYMARGVVLPSSKLVGGSTVSEGSARDVMRDAIAAVQYLHNLGIVHGDIKPGNLLRAGNGRVKLGDFGEARFNVNSTHGGNEPAPGTPAFLAPELCQATDTARKPAALYSSDIWALGATLYYLVYGRVPFLAKSVVDMYRAICTERLIFPIEPKTSGKLKDLLKRILNKNPDGRPSLRDIMRHPWFEGRFSADPGEEFGTITDEDLRNAIIPVKMGQPLEALGIR